MKTIRARPGRAGGEIVRIRKIMVLAAAVACLGIAAAAAQQAAKAPANGPGNGLPVRYEELTAGDFSKALAASGGTCIVPIGILEKHGPHLPLGTDLLDVRELALRAAGKEYSIVFPEYYVGQIFEAQHQPGTIAYSVRLMTDMLQETCDQLGRNGVAKIILVNGHGGNTQFLQFFCQSQLASRRSYVVYLFDPSDDESMSKELDKIRKTTLDGHAGESETSSMLAHRPDLVHMDRADQQSGEDLQRLSALKHAYTGIWWYASQPEHYRGYGTAGNKEFGDLALKLESDLLAETIRSVKADTVAPALQKEFYDKSERPLETKQGK